MSALKLVGVLVGTVGAAAFAGAGCRGNGGGSRDGGTGGVVLPGSGGSGGATTGGVTGSAGGGQAGSAGTGGSHDAGATGGAGETSGEGGAGEGPGGAGGVSAGGAGGVVSPRDAGIDAAGGAGCPPAAPPGPTWTQLPSPPAAVAGLTVTDAWPAGQDDFFFAGNFPFNLADGGSSGWAVLRWTQGCWNVEMIQTTTETPSPQISGTSPTDVWLTASDAIYHRDATGWTKQDNAWQAALPVNPFTVGLPSLTDVKAFKPTEVWFTSTWAVLRLLDGQWQAWDITSGTPNQPGSGYSTFQSVWVTSSTDVWAVGAAEIVGSTVPPAFANHFDGTSWTAFRVGNFAAYALWPAAAPEQFWVAVATGVQPNPLSFLDGTANPIDASTSISIVGWPAADEIVSLWGRSATDIWGAGEDIAHYNGTTWSEVPGTPDAVRDVNGVHSDSIVTGDATATWLAARGPTFFRQAAAP